MKYRQEIDELRLLTIIPVILFSCSCKTAPNERNLSLVFKINGY